MMTSKLNSEAINGLQSLLDTLSMFQRYTRESMPGGSEVTDSTMIVTPTNISYEAVSRWIAILQTAQEAIRKNGDEPCEEEA